MDLENDAVGRRRGVVCVARGVAERAEFVAALRPEDEKHLLRAAVHFDERIEVCLEEELGCRRENGLDVTADELLSRITKPLEQRLVDERDAAVVSERHETARCGV